MADFYGNMCQSARFDAVTGFISDYYNPDKEATFLV